MVDGREKINSSRMGVEECEGARRFSYAGTPAGNREEGGRETLGEEEAREKVQMTSGE